MVQMDDLKLEDEVIYLLFFYFVEVGMMNRLQVLFCELEQNFFVKKVDVQVLLKEIGIEYDEVQLQVIEEVICLKVMVLMGGLGMGKIIIMQGIIVVLKYMGFCILLVVFMGWVVKCMSEVIGMEFKIIYWLLEFNLKDGYKWNDENFLEGDVLIVDECLMIDIILMNNLMKVIFFFMCVVFVGDIDQLLSVGVGNVLCDIIESEKILVI